MAEIKPIKVFEPLPWQVEPWMDTSPVVLLTGGAGGGKSLLAAEKLHAFCLRYPGAQALVLRKTAQSLQNSAILMLQRHVIGNDHRVTHHVTNMRFEYDNGSILAYGGMKDDSQREFIRSIGVRGGVDIAWLEEATQFDEEDFNEVISRMRGTAAPWRQVILTTNPEGPGHWINMRLIIGGEASVYYSSAIDNLHNPDSYRQSLSTLTGVQYQRLVKGQWVMGSGLAFDTWSDTFNPKSGNDNGGNVTLDAEYIPDAGPVVWTIDDGYSGTRDKATGMFTGRSHPRAILMCQRRYDGQIAVYGEHYDIHKLAKQHLDEAVTYSKGFNWLPPYRVVRDRAAASLGGAIREVLNRTPIYNRVLVDESIKEMRDWLAPDTNGVRRLIVHPRCKHLRFEMSSYSISENGGVIKEHDNGPDALRYLVWDEAYGEHGDVDVASLVSLDDNDYVEQVANDIEHEEFAETGVDIAW
jgi:phage terminase large subunit